ADGVGRTAALLEAVSVDRGPRSWIMTDRPQLLTRRTRDLLERDLDTLEEAWGTRVPELKVQVTGPWTLAASIELASGHRVITDSGALRDLSEALVAGVNAHAAELARRFAADVIVQLDEPLLPDIAAGLPGVTRFNPIRPVHPKDLGDRLAGVVAGLDVERVLLNQTGYAPLWEVARSSGADTVLVTLDQVQGTAHFDGLGHTVSAGVRLGLGVTGPGDVVDELRQRPRERAVAVARFWEQLGLDPQWLSERVDIHPRAGFPTGPLLDAAGAYAMARVVDHMLRTDAGDL
ncbi:uroporphyrinogen decarboxylase/cobalamine-independent methonine synthase family protein, partial [Corynebacterium nasicanis]